jgi:hypothetical protein
MQDYPSNYGGDPSAMMAAMGPYMMVVGIIGLALFAFYIFLWWKIFAKAGHNGALALLNLAIIIPFVGWLVPLILTIWFAFSDWPALRKG